MIGNWELISQNVSNCSDPSLRTIQKLLVFLVVEAKEKRKLGNFNKMQERMRRGYSLAQANKTLSSLAWLGLYRVWFGEGRGVNRRADETGFFRLDIRRRKPSDWVKEYCTG